MKSRAFAMVWTALFGMALLFACGEKKESQAPVSGNQSKMETTAKGVTQGTKEAMETVKNFTADQKEQYIKMINAKLEEYDQKIDDLMTNAASKASELKGQDKDNWEKSVATLGEKQDAFALKIDELKSADSDKWESSKSGVDSAFKELSDAYNETLSQFDMMSKSHGR
jgi:hypothetical protein